MAGTTLEKPIRVGVFDTIDQGERAVKDLLQLGFRAQQISVICSDRFTQEHFKEFKHQRPAGERTPTAAAAGGAIGAILGGLTVLGVVTTGGMGVLAAGAIATATGAITGGFIG